MSHLPERSSLGLHRCSHLQMMLAVPRQRPQALILEKLPPAGSVKVMCFA